jgi:hypothetical protein
MSGFDSMRPITTTKEEKKGRRGIVVLVDVAYKASSLKFCGFKSFKEN